MLTYRMDERGEENLYEYLYACIRHDIESGAIRPHERMPSKRAFAQHLGVSVITVENAYAQLVAEGYLYTIERKGYFASPIFSGGTDARLGALSGTVRAEVPRTGGGRKTPEASGSEGAAPDKPPLIADFTGGAVTRLFPYRAWAKVMRDSLEGDLSDRLSEELSATGSRSLRVALADYLRGFRGMEVDPDRVVIGAGSQMLYTLIVQLLGRGRRYAVEEPGYPRLTKIYGACGASFSCVALDEAGVSMAALKESGADVVHCMPSHQYPTGLVTPISRRYELLGWANEQEGRYIIEDDYDCEFRFAGRPIPALQSIDAGGRVIYTNTFTKSLGPGVRIGYMVLPEKLAEAFGERLGFYSNTVSAIDQIALARFISGGGYEHHINRLRNHYRLIRDHLVKALKSSSFGDRVEVEHRDGGLHFVIRLDLDVPDGELARAARGQGVLIAPISSFMNAPERTRVFPRPFEHLFLVNYSGIPDEVVDPAVHALERAFAGFVVR